MNGRGDDSSEGFASIDAIVAMLVLAVTVALALQASAMARQLSHRAVATRQAGLLLNQLLADPRPTEPLVEGATDRHRWRLERRLAGMAADERAPRLCEWRAVVTDRRSGLAYQSRVMDLCQAAESDEP
ncbi:MAG TPA: hypothetical protein VEA44_15975 [Caulobacter sp.]|nr:hypothetical protein [Caulobacter sp.]